MQENPQFMPESLPLIPLRGLVMFPGMLLHFDAGRDRSIAALNHAMDKGKEILLVTQKDIRVEDPKGEDIYEIGCTAKIRQMLKVNDSEVKVLVEGGKRVFIHRIIEAQKFHIGEFTEVLPKGIRANALYKEAAIRHLKALFEDYAAVAPRLPNNVVMTIRATNSLSFISDFIASNLPFPVEDKQLILEEDSPLKRVELVTEILTRETELLTIDAEIAEKVKVQMDENHREYYMREQIKALNEELYGDSDPNDEAYELSEKIRSLLAPDEVKEKLLSEADKLRKMPFGSQEATVVRNYIETCIALPWGVYTKDNDSIKKATAVLKREHYGLEKVKERIVEALAVHNLTGTMGGSILCLVGPPGVGKTSIARSVANAMGRRFQRISLGGVRDEAEIRGHRKTYLGSMPGRIIDAVKQAGTANPVILLDEIDKLGADYKGDPSSALLEVLDPEQNNSFKDHFVDMPFDLSRVLFLTTANSLDTIPAPLRDRMEIIELSGYTRQDKFNIAKKYLIDKQMKKNGIDKTDCKFAASAIYGIIDYYTREAGVRKLEQMIGRICRKAAVGKASGKAEVLNVTNQNLKEFLGNPKFKDEQLLPFDEVGVVNGLAWTQVGGTLMQLEASVLDGSGKLELTGSLGDVMQESARTALSYVRSIAEVLGIDKEFYKNKDFHINATEAAIPKDGPSAGITMTVALVSALTGIPIKRDVAMTGEITLRGRVLPIGGLPEKSMAAYAAGVKTVFIPAANEPDLSEVDPKVLEKIQFIPVDNAWDVVTKALAGSIKKLESETLTPPASVTHRASARQ